MQFNEVEIEEITEAKVKRLLPAQQYLNTFKNGKELSHLTIDSFYEILEHLVEWETLEIRTAVLKGRIEHISPEDYIKSEFDEIKQD